MVSAIAKRACDCSFCVRSRRIAHIKEAGNPPQLLKLIDELHNDLSEVEDDLNYRKMILDGSWPQSVEILKRALARAQGIRVQESKGE